MHTGARRVGPAPGQPGRGEEAGPALCRCRALGGSGFGSGEGAAAACQDRVRLGFGEPAPGGDGREIVLGV